jgi:enoyl-CoA hydratase/carnithine racemase
MTAKALRVTCSGQVARITLCRPKTENAIDSRLTGELESACEDIQSNAEVRAVVLTAEGDTFSRGWDWEALAAVDTADDVFGCLAAMDKPVMCAINGDAVGAGLELALACDIRIAASPARFSFPELSMGLLPMAGGLQRLARLTGRGTALEFVLTGAEIDAEEALRIGLVSAVHPPDRFLEEADVMAARISENGPIATAYAKEAVARGIDMSLEEALRFETDLTIILQTTEDRAEGVRAFLEKRKPEFKGR